RGRREGPAAVGAGVRRGVSGRAGVRLLDRPAADRRGGNRGRRGSGGDGVRVPGPVVPADGGGAGGVPRSHAAAEREMGDGLPAGGRFSLSCPSDRKLVMIAPMRYSPTSMKIRMLVLLVALACWL